MMWGSELDRREGVRRQIVEDCAAYVDRAIIQHAISIGQEERFFLMTSVIERLVEKQRMEMQLMVISKELDDAIRQPGEGE